MHQCIEYLVIQYRPRGNLALHRVGDLNIDLLKVSVNIMFIMSHSFLLRITLSTRRNIEIGKFKYTH